MTCVMLRWPPRAAPPCRHIGNRRRRRLRTTPSARRAASPACRPCRTRGIAQGLMSAFQHLAALAGGGIGDLYGRHREFALGIKGGIGLRASARPEWSIEPRPRHSKNSRSSNTRRTAASAARIAVFRHDAAHIGSRSRARPSAICCRTIQTANAAHRAARSPATTIGRL